MPPAGYRKLRRDRAHRVVAGVAAGLAEHLRVPVFAVRVTFVVLLALNGVGALLYVAFWAILPVAAAGDQRDVRVLWRRSGRDAAQAVGLIAITAGVVIIKIQTGLGVDSTVVAFIALAALGAGIIWHQGEPNRRTELARNESVLRLVVRTAGAHDESAPGRWGLASVDTDRRWIPVRLVGGGLLIIVGIIGLAGFLAPRGSGTLSAILFGLFYAIVALLGLVLAFAPLLYRVFGELRDERVARIREQERAEVAAMVHDQVLHTLALIQRNSADAATVSRLARGQERTLRNWLYKPMGSPTDRFAAALEQIAAEVEDTYGITVETVVVADADHDDQVGAVVAAAREALVNAARHAKVRTVSLYAEVENDLISVYVRDRGAGFDFACVGDDRHGVRGSIISRMRRHGGQAHVRTALGEGTEVELIMPRRRPSPSSQPDEPGRRERGEQS